MIDLSFLTEEEQETIRAVLKRDAQLKKAEEQRVQKLHKTVHNKEQLRYLTGEWFYETKQLRHQDRIHGSDIIRASMKHTYKPLTILELSQILPEDSSFVSSENKDVFVPPLLCGLLREVGSDRHPDDHQPDAHKPAVQSPTKRKNPFNSEFGAHHEQHDGEDSQAQAQNDGSFTSSDSFLFYTSSLRQDPCLVTHNASENQADNTSSQDCFVDGPENRRRSSAVLRGILKHLSSSSSADSPVSDPDLQNPADLDLHIENWTDRKQVRFNSTIRRSALLRQSRREMGEDSLLDGESNSPSEMEINQLGNGDLDKSGCNTSGTQRLTLGHSGEEPQEVEVIFTNEVRPLKDEVGQHHVLGDVFEHSHSELLIPAMSTSSPEQVLAGKRVHLKTEPAEDAQPQAEAADEPTGQKTKDRCVEARSDPKTSPILVSLESLSLSSLSPRLRQKLFGIFKRQKERKAEVQNKEKNDATVHKEEPGVGQMPAADAADVTVKKQVTDFEHEATPVEKVPVRTLQLAALQNTTFKETVSIIDAATQQEVSEDKSVQVPEKLSYLRAFWERGNTSPQIIYSRQEANREDTSEASHETNNISAPNKITVEDSTTPLEMIVAPQTEYNLLDSKEDTYRARPVLIYEETDDVLIVSSSVPFNAQNQPEAASSPFHPRQSNCSPPGERSVKINDLKHFWESGYNGTKIITPSVKETWSCSTPADRVVSPQSDLKRSLDKREEPEKTSVAKSMKVTVKGFVTQSPERTQKGSAQADKESPKKTLSPSKSLIPKLKDQDDEVRKSPSKTCHPRVLPRESSSPKRSKLDGSPLKTFPININPEAKEQQEKPPPLPREGMSPTRGAKGPNAKTNTDLTSCPPEVEGPRCDRLNKMKSNSSPSTSPKSKTSPEKKMGTLTRLARAFIPQDNAHYLGPQDTLFAPPFDEDKGTNGESDAAHSHQNDLTDLAENQSDTPEGNRPRAASWVGQKKDGNSSRGAATRAWSLSRPSSGSYDDAPNSIMSTLKRLSARMSASKSLENLTSQPREERTRHDSEEQINLSVDDVSSISPSTSYARPLKGSVSVPVLHQDEADSDFEPNLGRRRNTSSSTSNISLSSGMASMSSVSGSTSSIYHADSGDVEVQGNIQFAMNYIQKLGEFHIFVVHCRDLAVADTKKNRSDPYVKCYLLPDKPYLGKRKTTIKKKTLNPDYNEVLQFKTTKQTLATQNLNVSVWHNDTFGRNVFLGETDVDLSEWNFSNTQINEYALKPRVSAPPAASSPSRMFDSRGQMRVALRFLPQTSHSKRPSRMETGEVQIWVKDCKNLPSVRGVIIDPFVKCTVLPDTSRKSRQKTRVVKRTTNPMFNHTMVYDGFRSEDLREACVEITVWDHDRLNSQFVGGLRLGLGTGKSYGLEAVWMDSTAAEATLWQRMLESGGEWVEDLLPLRMFAISKSMSK